MCPTDKTLVSLSQAGAKPFRLYPLPTIFLSLSPLWATGGFCIGVGVSEVRVQKLRGWWEGWAPLSSEHEGPHWGAGSEVSEPHPEKNPPQGIEIPSGQ